MDNDNTNDKDVEIIDQQPKTPIQKCKEFLKKHRVEFTVGTLASFGICLELYSLYQKYINNENVTEIKTKPTIDLIDDIELSEESRDPQQTKAPHTTSAYIRKLPEGQKLSQEKREQMMALNMPVDNGTVLVNSYNTEDHS